MPKDRILIIEDEREIQQLLQMNLTLNGFHDVLIASDGESGLAEARRHLPNLILLDLMLPGMDGLSVCRLLKTNPATSGIPIIMLTAKSEESDIVLGLEMGANDYVTKPFSNKVLISRIRVQLRRDETTMKSIIRCGDLVMNDENRSVVLKGERIELTYSEFEILWLLAYKRGRVYTRNQIISEVKGNDYPVTERAIDVQIVNIRRKLGDWGENLETVRGVGYRMRECE
ncbi:MAG: response regulator transcription factor [Planctomycetia bacterium]|nr:response regulator transcription factor [Planctomycetia bacterium]